MIASQKCQLHLEDTAYLTISFQGTLIAHFIYNIDKIDKRERERDRERDRDRGRDRDRDRDRETARQRDRETEKQGIHRTTSQNSLSGKSDSSLLLIFAGKGGFAITITHFRYCNSS